MPLVGFRGALRVGDRASVPGADRWRRSARFRRNQGPQPPVGGALPENAMEWVDIATDQIGFLRRRPWRTRRPQPRSGISRRRPAWRRVALKGDRLRPLRSAQAVAVHQDGIGGHGHPVERCRFLPGPSEIRRCAGRGERQGFAVGEGAVAAARGPIAGGLHGGGAAFRDGWTAWRRRTSRNPAAPRNAVLPWAGAPRRAASRWEAAANPWLGVIARCSRTGSSNPSPSSGESTANFTFYSVYGAVLGTSRTRVDR